MQNSVVILQNGSVWTQNIQVCQKVRIQTCPDLSRPVQAYPGLAIGCSGIHHLSNGCPVIKDLSCGCQQDKSFLEKNSCCVLFVEFMTFLVKKNKNLGAQKSQIQWFCADHCPPKDPKSYYLNLKESTCSCNASLSESSLSASPQLPAEHQSTLALERPAYE